MTQPNTFIFADDYDAHAAAVMDRYQHGDLRVFRQWVQGYVAADVRVECRVLYSSKGNPAIRALAHRMDENGFFATQGGDDVIDVYSLSPYDLGPAVAGVAALTKPGGREEIQIPGELLPRAWTEAERPDDAEPFSVRVQAVSPATTTIKASAFTATATVQSHWLPVRSWGFDHGKNAAVWVTVENDGDYICRPGTNGATPMTKRLLTSRIDELIAEDVASLREVLGR
ncbi:ESX secretion-associated protein EspG [Mycobacterium sp. pUA109]|uniref:ESX secretion-associated protein EspG n=1 Tax=Mycobacterium sp. pUA109 TaxID=3238982 RepID=UPI00351AFC36